MKCRRLPTPCSSPFRVSWLFLVIFGFPSGQDRFSKLSRAFPPEKENGRTVPREIRRAFSLATDGGYCQTCPKRKCFRFSWSFYTTHSGLRFLHRTGIALSRSGKNCGENRGTGSLGCDTYIRRKYGKKSASSRAPWASLGARAGLGAHRSPADWRICRSARTCKLVFPSSLPLIFPLSIFLSLV